MNSFYDVFDILKKMSDLEKDKIAFMNHCDSTINNCRMEIIDIISKSNIQYDFYHSYKHYINLSKDLDYFNVYYKVNNKYMPIVTDICLSGHNLTENNYEDYIKIATGTLSNLTIYCDSSSVETFPNYINLKSKNEIIDFD